MAFQGLLSEKLGSGRQEESGQRGAVFRTDQSSSDVTSMHSSDAAQERDQTRVVERREANRRQGITSDQTIEFTSAHGRGRCPRRLRRIGCRDPETGRHCVFLTTNFQLSAKTIADIYRSRWPVELFFNWDQAEPEGEELRGHAAQRGHEAALDRHVHVPDGVLPQVRQPPPLEPRRSPAPFSNSICSSADLSTTSSEKQGARPAGPRPR